METWMWISLYLLQTLLGAVLWRKFIINNDKKDNGIYCLICSSFVITNLYFLLYAFILFLGFSVDFLAGVKKKEK